MKKLVLFSLIISNLFSCNVTENINPKNNNSYWSFDGKDFKAFENARAHLFRNAIVADDNNGNRIVLDFGFIRKPTKSEKFNVVGGKLGVVFFSNIHECSFFIENTFTGASYISSGKNGETISLEVSKFGKISCIFKDIEIENYNGPTSKTYKLSGVLIEE